MNLKILIECPKCEAEFSYIQEDIKTYKVHIDDLNIDYDREYINCPNCGHKIVLSFYL